MSAPPQAWGAVDRPRSPRVTGVLRAEFRKITTTRLWWIMWLCIFVLGGGYAALPATVALLEAGAAGAPSPFDDPGITRSIYNGGNTLSRILAMVVGIAAMGSEYRHQTLAATYLATPRRLKVLLGKAWSLLLFGLLYGATSVAAGMIVAAGFILSQDGQFFLGRADTWRSLLLGVCSIALWTMIGMGIGILIKNMLVAMLVGISFAYLVEPILVGRVLPAGVGPAAQPDAQRGHQRDARDHLADTVRRPAPLRLVAGRAGAGGLVPGAGDRRGAVHCASGRVKGNR